MAASSGKHLFTLLSTFKDFEGADSLTQTCAVQSWKHHHIPAIIFGQEKGVQNISQYLGAHHIPDVQTSESGTPLLSDIISTGAKIAATPYIALINGDIILDTRCVQKLDEALTVLNNTSEDLFLLSIRRRNIPVTLSFSTSKEAVDYTLEMDTQYGNWDKDDAIDIFVFPTTLYDNVPDMAIGRAGWDNWLLWQARNRGAKLLDLSSECSLKHPIHGYFGSLGGWKNLMTNQDTVSNRKIVANKRMTFSDMEYYYSKGQFLPYEDIDSQDWYFRDNTRELSGALEYLLLADISPVECLEICKTLLWRFNLYFPFSATTEPTKTQLQTCKDLQKTKSVTSALEYLQDCVCDPFLEIFFSDTPSTKYVYGAGDLCGRFFQLLARKHITQLPVILAKECSNKALQNMPIHQVSIIEDQQISFPKILITSMYINEILAENDQLFRHTKAKIFY